MNYRLMTDRDRHNYMFRQTNGLAGKQIKIERQRQRQRQANWYGPLYCLTDTSTIETPHSYMPINMLMSAISSRVHSARSNTPSKAKLPCEILWAIEPIAVRPLGTKQLLGITTTPHNRQVTQKNGTVPYNPPPVQCCISGGGDTPAILNVFWWLWKSLVVVFNCFPCWGKSTFISETHTHTVPNKTNVPVTSRPNTDNFPFSTFSHAIQRLSLLSIIIPDDNKRRKKSLYTRIFSNMKIRFHYTSPFSPSFFSIFISFFL